MERKMNTHGSTMAENSEYEIRNKDCAYKHRSEWI